jgi:hypothetical protein
MSKDVLLILIAISSNIAFILAIINLIIINKKGLK